MKNNDPTALPWAQSPFSMRCPAVRKPRLGKAAAKLIRGRCELRRGHDGDHALVRGGIVLRWSDRLDG